MPTAFKPFSPSHIVALLITFGVAIAMVWAGRNRPASPALRWTAEILAWTVLMGYPLYLFVALTYGFEIQSTYLPMHLCNWAAVLAFVGLRWRKPLICELLYFWGLAGTFQALFTPNITVGFPHPGCIQFFLLHSGIVIAALYLTFGQGYQPRPGAVWRAWLWCQVYIVAASLTNWLTNSNYGFLSHKPEAGSLMDYLGPAPYHVIGLEILGFILFALLNLPFLKQQKLAARQEKVDAKV